MSVGFLDHKTGMSLFSYTYTFFKQPKHESFVGFGTLVAMNTLAAGWKLYLFDYYLNFYTVLAGHLAAGMGKNILIIPFAHLGAEKAISDKWFINVGVNNSLRIYKSRKSKVLIFPSVNVNYRY